MNIKILEAIEAICDDIAGDANAADNKVRAEAVAILVQAHSIAPDAEFELTETNSESLQTYTPGVGKRFTYKGMDFVSLGIAQGGVLAVTAETIDEDKPFDKDGCNDWCKSSLRKELNEEFIKKFNKDDLLPFVSDLTADSGRKDYGKSEDYIFLLSCDLQREFVDVLPNHNYPHWTITPWHIYPDVTTSHGVRIVSSSGAMSSYEATSRHGVAPACLFNPKIFEQSAPIGAKGVIICRQTTKEKSQRVKTHLLAY